MLFNSFEYVVFLPLVIMLYYVIPQRFRWVMLLAASYYFYMCWKVEYAALIMLSTAVDYWAGIKMSAQDSRKKRRKFLFASLFVNLGLLFFFKYFNFFSHNLELTLGRANIFYDSPAFNLLLPVGISFYTFQTLSYTIDIYLGKAKAERHLGYFALYVSYFPQLVAGPIERSTRLIPQLRKPATVTADDFRYAINKILLGFFKKVVVADTVAIYVDQMYGSVPNGTGLQYYFTVVLFATQLFCDFSGYTDIAIGSARLMGVRLMENFDRPFLTTNLGDFWQRWHISLTSWIRDYMFVPMVKKLNNAAVTSIIVFVVIGIWHGASWNFVIFGLFHGVVMIIQRLLMQIKLYARFEKTTVGRWILIVVNFHLLVFSGIFFRTQTLSQAWEVMKHIATDFRIGLGELQSPFQTEFLMAAMVSLMALGTALFNKKLTFRINWLYILIMLVLTFFLGQDLANQFIYFQF